MWRPSSIIALCLATVLSAGAAGAAPGDDCDRLAGDPSDPDRVGLGVADGRIDAAAATAACTAAVAAAPSEARFRYQLARADFAAGRDKAGLAHLTEAADAGHARAQALLGLMYESGRYGLAADVAKAVALLKAAAAQGEPYAAYRMGQRYEDGDGVPQDDREALVNYSKAAERGFKKAREAADRMEAKQKRAGGPFEITSVRYPPYVVAGGIAGELRVGYFGEPQFPVEMTLLARACVSGVPCAPQTHQVAAADAAGELVWPEAVTCAGVTATWHPDYQLTLQDALGQQSTPRSLRTVCYPDQAAAEAEHGKRR